MPPLVRQFGQSNAIMTKLQMYVYNFILLAFIAHVCEPVDTEYNKYYRGSLSNSKPYLERSGSDGR